MNKIEKTVETYAMFDQTNQKFIIVGDAGFLDPIYYVLHTTKEYDPIWKSHKTIVEHFEWLKTKTGYKNDSNVDIDSLVIVKRVTTIEHKYTFEIPGNIG